MAIAVTTIPRTAAPTVAALIAVMFFPFGFLPRWPESFIAAV